MKKLFLNDSDIDEKTSQVPLFNISCIYSKKQNTAQNSSISTVDYKISTVVFTISSAVYKNYSAD